MSSTTTFRDLIAANKRNSLLLAFVFSVFVVLAATIVGLAIVAAFAGDLPTDLGGAVIAGFVLAAAALGLSAMGYFGGDRLVLGVSGARAIEHADDPELFNVVEEMAIAAGTPMPRVYLMEDSAPNAFATGRDPQHAAVAVTTGMRSKLTRDELQGVIAHEMSHIRNYDIRLMLLMAVLIGTLAILSDFLWRATFFGSRGRRSNREGGGGALVLVLLAAGIVLAVLAPILAQIIQLAVSRQREYLADASAVELTRNPQGLAKALRKIDTDQEVLETANRGTAHLYIANPIKAFERRAGSIFASHPPIKERIQRLEALLQ